MYHMNGIDLSSIRRSKVNLESILVDEDITEEGVENLSILLRYWYLQYPYRICHDKWSSVDSRTGDVFGFHCRHNRQLWQPMRT